MPPRCENAGPINAGPASQGGPNISLPAQHNKNGDFMNKSNGLACNTYRFVSTVHSTLDCSRCWTHVALKRRHSKDEESWGHDPRNCAAWMKKVGVTILVIVLAFDP